VKVIITHKPGTAMSHITKPMKQSPS